MRQVENHFRKFNNLNLMEEVVAEDLANGFNGNLRK
jgi:hypothetical protein